MKKTHSHGDRRWWTRARNCGMQTQQVHRIHRWRTQEEWGRLGNYSAEAKHRACQRSIGIEVWNMQHCPEAIKHNRLRCKLRDRLRGSSKWWEYRNVTAKFVVQGPGEKYHLLGFEIETPGRRRKYGADEADQQTGHDSKRTGKPHLVNSSTKEAAQPEELAYSPVETWIFCMILELYLVVSSTLNS